MTVGLTPHLGSLNGYYSDSQGTLLISSVMRLWCEIGATARKRDVTRSFAGFISPERVHSGTTGATVLRDQDKSGSGHVGLFGSAKRAKVFL